MSRYYCDSVSRYYTLHKLDGMTEEEIQTSEDLIELFNCVKQLKSQEPKRLLTNLGKVRVTPVVVRLKMYDDEVMHTYGIIIIADKTNYLKLPPNENIIYIFPRDENQPVGGYRDLKQVYITQNTQILTVYTPRDELEKFIDSREDYVLHTFPNIDCTFTTFDYPYTMKKLFEYNDIILDDVVKGNLLYPLTKWVEFFDRYAVMNGEFSRLLNVIQWIKYKDKYLEKLVYLLLNNDEYEHRPEYRLGYVQVKGGIRDAFIKRLFTVIGNTEETEKLYNEFMRITVKK